MGDTKVSSFLKKLDKPCEEYAKHHGARAFVRIYSQADNQWHYLLFPHERSGNTTAETDVDNDLENIVAQITDANCKFEKRDIEGYDMLKKNLGPKLQSGKAKIMYDAGEENA